MGYNSDSPSLDDALHGDNESLMRARATAEICANPVAIEAVRALDGVDALKTGDVFKFFSPKKRTSLRRQRSDNRLQMRRLQSALLVSARNDSSAAARSRSRSERNVSLGADAIREAVRRLQGLLSRLEFLEFQERI